MIFNDKVFFSSVSECFDERNESTTRSALYLEDKTVAVYLKIVGMITIFYDNQLCCLNSFFC